MSEIIEELITCVIVRHVIHVEDKVDLVIGRPSAHSSQALEKPNHKKRKNKLM
jgi:hypothetical protein